MGIFDKLFGRKENTAKIDSYFKAFNAYTPSFRTFDGGLYEMELTRAAVHAFANQCSKLKPEVVGKARRDLENPLQFMPNEYMDTTKFLYRLATILAVNNTAFILPLFDRPNGRIVGLYPLSPLSVDIVDYKNNYYLRFTLPNGKRDVIEFSKVGILTQFLYRDDFFGESNAALSNTLKLIDIQNQGMQDAIKQSAKIRFMAKIGNVMRPEMIKAERDNFSSMNLSAENTTGVMMFDNKYTEVKQIDSKPYLIDWQQMESIKKNVFNYFGVNEDILQNKFNEDTWNAFYEGKIEPFATQLSLVLTNMIFSETEKSFGNSIVLSSNRMQYASNTTKLQVATQLFDRGILTTNDIMDIYNLPHVEDGDKRYIRREYTESKNLDSEYTHEEIGDSDNADSEQ